MLPKNLKLLGAALLMMTACQGSGSTPSEPTAAPSRAASAPAKPAVEAPERSKGTKATKAKKKGTSEGPHAAQAPADHSHKHRHGHPHELATGEKVRAKAQAKGEEAPPPAAPADVPTTPEREESERLRKKAIVLGRQAETLQDEGKLLQAKTNATEMITSFRDSTTADPTSTRARHDYCVALQEIKERGLFARSVLTGTGIH